MRAGTEGLLLASGFIDGGVTGISMLLAQAFGWPLAWLLLGINITKTNQKWPLIKSLEAFPIF